MATDPQGFFQFAADHYPLLVDLYYRVEGVNDAELLALAERHRSERDPSPSYVADRLLKLGILETVPDATAVYEVVRPVRNLLGFLLVEHRLTSAPVLQAYLTELEALGAELDQAVAGRRGAQVARVLAEASDLVERVRQDSRANRDAIVREVLALKSNRERRSPRERFEIVNRLWTRFLEPLRDLIDVRQAMDQTLEGLGLRAREGARAFALDGALVREFSRLGARLLRLRREAADDFREAVREVEPLYQALRRESELVRGASRALERLGREGLGPLGLAERLALPVWRREGLFADAALEAFLRDLRGYRPGRPPPLPEAEEGAGPAFLDPGEVAEALGRELPVSDALAWLAARYPEAPLAELLRAYGRIHAGSLGPVSFGERARAYRLGGVRVEACPLCVEAA
ncbi:MAG: hypothetical protein AB1578_01760 [Thermodesulfobacteriota bacterium]